jgi:hypothetical protein
MFIEDCDNLRHTMFQVFERVARNVVVGAMEGYNGEKQSLKAGVCILLIAVMSVQVAHSSYF